MGKEEQKLFYDLAMATEEESNKNRMNVPVISHHCLEAVKECFAQ